MSILFLKFLFVWVIWFINSINQVMQVLVLETDLPLRPLQRLALLHQFKQGYRSPRSDSP